MDLTKEYNKEVVFYVNKVRHCLKYPNVDPTMTLAQYLRSGSVRLMGTKIACYEGGCGACSVMISFLDSSSQIEHRVVNSCLFPLCGCDGLSITTVEGLGNSKKPSVEQKALAEKHGTQCGFCSPGFSIAMHTLMKSKMGSCSVKDIEEAFDGNLCRCTGYRPIYDATKAVVNGEFEDEDSGEPKLKICHRSEPEFPEELAVEKAKPLVIVGDTTTWIRPMVLAHFLRLRMKYPDAPIVNGNTEVSLRVRYMAVPPKVLISAAKVSELNGIEFCSNGVNIGPSTTVSTIRHTFAEQVKIMKEKNNGSEAYSTRVMDKVSSLLKFFGSEQVRNCATIGGNVCEGKRQSDFSPTIVAAGAKLKLMKFDEKNDKVVERIIDLDLGADQYFVGKRTVALDKGEVLVNIFIPYTLPNEFYNVYKQATRRDDDITTVTGAFRVAFENEKPDSPVKKCHFAFSGMHYRCASAYQTQKFLCGRVWSDELLPEIQKLLLLDFPEENYDKYGQVAYRQRLATSFFFKFFLFVAQQRNPSSIPSRHKSATLPYSRPPLKSSQDYASKYFTLDGEELDKRPVGMSVPHNNALIHATGEAMFIDDMPDTSDTLHASFVWSTRANAKIQCIEKSTALKMPGVFRILTAEDIPGENKMGDIILDEPLLAHDKVQFCGQPIAIVLASSRVLAQRAAMSVKVSYSDVKPAILTCEDAIENNSFFADERNLNHGDVDSFFANLPDGCKVLTGQNKTSSQEHFYLETQTAFAQVSDVANGEIILYSSTQNPSKVQGMSCGVLGIDFSRLVVKSKRVGGGFGGKETQSVWIGAATALAAYVTGRPVRVSLERDEDMASTGKRHAYLGNYKCGYDSNGKVYAVDMVLYANGGYSYDVTMPVIERAMFHTDNAYNFPNFRIRARACQTNLPTSTAFRGFGAPQGMSTTENMLSKIAADLGIPTEVVRSRNFYREGDSTFYGMPLCPPNPLSKPLVSPSSSPSPLLHLQKMWDQIQDMSNYVVQKKEVDKFNVDNRWRKRGISIVPLKYGLCVTAKFMNQAGALVHIYLDGSVRISIAGTELGQGLYTKCCQVAAAELRIPLSLVHIAETTTDCVANTMPTVASVQSDLNGNAVINACDQLNARLEPYRQKNKTWNDIVTAAHFDRVNLSANGFYATENLNFDWKTGRGKPFNYFSYGMACNTVEIDVLTGDYIIKRSDILYDVGNSLSPEIDIGQIEGAFLQGVGMNTLEELQWFPDGTLFSNGPGMYKIPSGDNIPQEWNIHLLKDSPNSEQTQKRLHGSKGIGEPPLLLSYSVLEAIRNAITSAREEEGHTGWFDLSSPFTPEKIRVSCLAESPDIGH